MSRAIDVSLDGVRIPIARERVAAIADGVLRAERVPNALLSVAFVTRTRIAALNRAHLGHAGPTDVISFGFARATDDDPVIGDIYICPDVARASAAERGIGIREELARLVVHGTLHVLGYDHPESDARERSPMWKRQEALLARLTRQPRT
ncbi:MAG TPA: rRNA maturation RNase YbeY [Gemmatimonadaceae bacterium]|nr:rRNA maturation RNase YbeY [Gemmatimonadaceae bacterium]